MRRDKSFFLGFFVLLLFLLLLLLGKRKRDRRDGWMCGGVEGDGLKVFPEIPPHLTASPRGMTVPERPPSSARVR